MSSRVSNLVHVHFALSSSLSPSAIQSICCVVALPQSEGDIADHYQPCFSGTPNMEDGHLVADCYTTRKDSSNNKDLCHVSLFTHSTHVLHILSSQVLSVDHMTMNCVVMRTILIMLPAVACRVLISSTDHFDIIWLHHL